MIYNNLAEQFQQVYEQPIKSTRTGGIFNAHSYPTKINVEAILPFILIHTKPGDVIFDGFAGTGVTGIASALCADPNPELKQAVESILGKVEWGERNAELYDLSVLATFIGKTLLDAPEPKKFEQAAISLLKELEQEWGWMYEVKHSEHGQGKIRYTIWSDYPVCPECGTSTSFWNLAIELTPPNIASKGTCPNCASEFDLSTAERTLETYIDDVLGQTLQRRKRKPVIVYGQTGQKYWRREVTSDDEKVFNTIEEVPIPKNVPVVKVLDNKNKRWGELYRAGYHFGLTHLHHFYTRRNLIALGKAWEMIETYPSDLQDALRMWISSYNATHSTIMTRVVAKKSAKDLVVTGAQPGTLYISSLPVEKNIISGLRTKLKPIIAAFHEMQKRQGKISFHCGSSLSVDLPDASIDYIFTDPPFGNNIQYSEVNFIGEAWLGTTTNQVEEVIISPYQGKSVKEYEALLSLAFSEAYRVLKPGHFMTVVFHSTQATVWNALQAAWKAAGFEIIYSSILDKTQSSFKQTTTNGAVRGDPVILLYKPDIPRVVGNIGNASQDAGEDPWSVIDKRLSDLNVQEQEERTKQRLYSYFITYFLTHGYQVPIGSGEFFGKLDKRYINRDGYYYNT